MVAAQASSALPPPPAPSGHRPAFGCGAHHSWELVHTAPPGDLPWVPLGPSKTRYFFISTRGGSCAHQLPGMVGLPACALCQQQTPCGALAGGKGYTHLPTLPAPSLNPLPWRSTTPPLLLLPPLPLLLLLLLTTVRCPTRATTIAHPAAHDTTPSLATATPAPHTLKASVWLLLMAPLLLLPMAPPPTLAT